MKNTIRNAVDRIVKLAILAAMSIVLMLLIRFPIFPQLGFLEYDMADVPIFIGAFMYGPVWGLVLTFVVCVLQGVTVSAGSGWIGILMHFIATGAFVIVAGLIYRGERRTLKHAVLALCAGTIAMVVTMIPLNHFMTPLFIGGDYKAAQGTVWNLMPYIIAFNAIKAGVNAVLTFLLYKAVGKLLKLRIVK